MSRADKYSPAKKKEYYSDFLNNLDMNPVTGTLARVTNEESVKQALKNLILTNKTERPYNPYFGSRINAMLFDLIDEGTANLIESEIRETITNFEPRVIINDLVVEPRDEDNGYMIKLVFTTINIPQEISLELFLQRVR